MPPARRDPVAWWFFALGVIVFLSLNVDYVVVGHFGDMTQVGLYSLAFAMAFAPVTQFAWQIGKVLFASAARADDPTAIGARAARSARLTALLVWPLVPPAFVLAPHVLPQLLGPEWQPMVLPFQLLLIVGAMHAVLAVVREFLLGAGNVRACFVVDADLAGRDGGGAAGAGPGARRRRSGRRARRAAAPPDGRIRGPRDAPPPAPPSRPVARHAARRRGGRRRRPR